LPSSIIIFGHRHLCRFAVDLTGRCKQQFPIVRDAGFDHMFSTLGVGDERTQWFGNNVPYAHCSGEMEYRFGFSDQRIHQINIQNRSFHKTNMVTSLTEILQVARRKVVEHHHVVTKSNEPVDEV
jgi:hypothetical protein